MKHEPQPANHMEKQLGWVHMWVGQSLWGSSRGGQTVLARLMEFQIWDQVASFVQGGFRKGTMASACLDDRYFSFSPYAAGAFQAATPVLVLRDRESEHVSPCGGFLRRTAWGSISFLPLTQSPLVFAARSWGDIFLELEPWTGEPGVGLGLLAPKISL